MSETGWILVSIMGVLVGAYGAYYAVVDWGIDWRDA